MRRFLRERRREVGREEEGRSKDSGWGRDLNEGEGMGVRDECEWKV
jgi:hypothetical protein